MTRHRSEERRHILSMYWIDFKFASIVETLMLRQCAFHVDLPYSTPPFCGMFKR
jgi:hypothetical protein